MDDTFSLPIVSQENAISISEFIEDESNEEDAIDISEIRTLCQIASNYRDKVK